MENFDQIEKYLLDKLSMEERLAFEKRLESDDALKSETETTRKLILGIKSHALSQKLKTFSIPSEEKTTNVTTETKVIKLGTRSYSLLRNLSLAASFVALFLLSWWFFQGDSPNSVQGMDNIFYTDPGLPTPMSETDHYVFFDAMVDYKSGKYQVALEKWNTVENGISPDTLTYYKAMALYGLDRYEEALEELNKIEPGSELFTQSKWYAAACHAQNGDITTARMILNTIEASPYFDKTAALKYLDSVEN